MSQKSFAAKYNGSSSFSGAGAGDTDIFGIKTAHQKQLIQAQTDAQKELENLSQQHEIELQKLQSDLSDKLANSASIRRMAEANGIVATDPDTGETTDAFRKWIDTVTPTITQASLAKAQTGLANQNTLKTFAESDQGQNTLKSGQAGLNVMPAMQAAKEGTINTPSGGLTTTPNPSDLLGTPTTMLGSALTSQQFGRGIDPSTGKMVTYPTATTTEAPGSVRRPVGQIDPNALQTAPTSLNQGEQDSGDEGSGEQPSLSTMPSAQSQAQPGMLTNMWNTLKNLVPSNSPNFNAPQQTAPLSPTGQPLNLPNANPTGQQQIDPAILQQKAQQQMLQQQQLIQYLNSLTNPSGTAGMSIYGPK
jgi:hypothetical protein